MTVRAADVSDTLELTRLRYEMTAEESTPAVLLDQFAASFVPWATDALASRRWVVLVAERDGRLVGTAWLELVDRVPRPGPGAPRIAYLTNVYVEPGSRNLGWGGALVAAATAAAEREGCSQVVVWPSDRSIPLYRRFGFDDPPDPFLERALPVPAPIDTPDGDELGAGRERRAALDLAALAERARNGPCFICAFLTGEPGYEHELLYQDEERVAFLARYPTLRGYTIVAPRRHLEQIGGDLSKPAHVALQALVYDVADALRRVLPVERVYVLSLGSNEGNAHVHWHVAPLPPGVPYEQQQYRALMAEYGVIEELPDERGRLAAAIRRELRAE